MAAHKKSDLAFWFHQLVNQEIGDTELSPGIKDEAVRHIIESPQLALDLCETVQRASIHQSILKIGFHEIDKPLKRHQISHVEPCDIFATGRNLVKKLDLLFDPHKRCVQTIAEFEEDQKNFEALVKEVESFMEMVKKKNFKIQFHPMQPKTEQEILKNFDGYQLRRFFLSFLQKNNVVIEDAYVEIKSAEEELAQEAREMYLRPGPTGVPSIIWLGTQLPLHPSLRHN